MAALTSSTRPVVGGFRWADTLCMDAVTYAASRLKAWAAGSSGVLRRSARSCCRLLIARILKISACMSLVALVAGTPACAAHPTATGMMTPVVAAVGPLRSTWAALTSICFNFKWQTLRALIGAVHQPESVVKGLLYAVQAAAEGRGACAANSGAVPPQPA